MDMKFTDENVNEIIASGKPVVIDFWATWCGPCMAMAPIIDELAAEYEGRVVIGKYNVDEENDFCSENSVRSLPTLLFFKDGKKTDLRLVGGQKADAIRAKIDELLAR
ncbi:MAG: thioredoxin [Muribaculaceae bacterium]|nr:thioredoxin [Muribaculaceae bacterium]